MAVNQSLMENNSLLDNQNTEFDQNLQEPGQPVMDQPQLPQTNQPVATDPPSPLQRYLGALNNIYTSKALQSEVFTTDYYNPVESTVNSSINKFIDTDYGFNPYRDNDDFYGKLEPWYKTLGKAPLRLTAYTGVKIGQGVGFVLGLANPTNWDQDIITNASENAMTQMFDSLDENLKNDWLPTYQEAADRDKGFFARAFTDLDFWTEDVVDGAAFVASAWVPGLGLSKLQAGTKLMQGLSRLRVGASAVEKAIEGGSKVQRFITGAEKYGKTLDKFNAWAFATASESMFEAAEVKKKVYDSLSGTDEFGFQRINPNTNQPYTEEEKKEIAGKAAQNTFFMNAALLGGTNVIELRWLGKFFGGADDAALRGVTGGTQIGEKMAIKEATGRFGKFLDSKKFAVGKGLATGIGVEGYIEENGQLAISRLNEAYGSAGVMRDMLDMVSMYDEQGFKLPEILDQYIGQTLETLPFLNPDTQESRETAMNIGLGGLLGGGMASVKAAGDYTRDKAYTKSMVDLYNTATDNFMKFGNIYKTEKVNVVDAQGNTVVKEQIVLDKNNQPIIDKEKLAAASLSFKNVSDALTEADQTPDPFQAKILRDTAWTELVKAHIKAGRDKQLLESLDKTLQSKPEDLIKLGFVADERTPELTARYKSLAQKIVAQNKLINDSVLTDNSKEDQARKNYLLDVAAKQAIFSNIADEYNSEINNLKALYPQAEQKDLTDSLVGQLNDITQRIKSHEEYIADLKNNKATPKRIERAEAVLEQLNKRKADLVKNNEGGVKELQEGKDGFYLYKTEELNKPGINDQIRKKSKLRGELLNQVDLIGDEWALFADTVKGKQNFVNFFKEETEALLENIKSMTAEAEAMPEPGKKFTLSYKDKEGNDKTRELQLNSFYVGPLTTTNRYRKEKPVVTFNNDLIKIDSVDETGVTVTIYQKEGKESVKFTNQEFGEILEENKWVLYNTLNPDQKLYLKLRNSEIQYRIIRSDKNGKFLPRDPKTGKYPTAVVTGRVTLSKDKKNLLFTYIDPTTGNQKFVDFNQKYVVDQKTLSELPEEEKFLLQQNEEKLQRKLTDQKQFLSNLITETEAKLTAAQQRRDNNRTQIAELQRDLQGYKNLLDEAVKTLEQNPYSGKGRKSNLYKETSELAEELKKAVAETEVKLAELQKEKEELDSLLKTLNGVNETYYQALVEIEDSGSPMLADESGVIYGQEENRVQELLDGRITNRFTADQLVKMAQDTELDLEIVNEEIAAVQSVLDNLKGLLKNILAFQEVADALMNISDRDQLRNALKLIEDQQTVLPEDATEEQIAAARENDKIKKDLVKALRKGLARGDQGIEAQYALELIDRYKQTSARLEDLLKKQAELGPKLQRLSAAAVQEREISSLQERIDFLKTVQQGLMAEYGKKKQQQMAQRQAQTAEVMQKQTAGALAADEEVSQDSQTDKFDNLKPLLSITSLFTTAGRHFKDAADTELNEEDNNALFYKLSAAANLMLDEYYLMPVTKDNDQFGIRREDAFEDDIKLIVVKKVGNEYKYVDQNGNVLENPTKETLVYTSMRGNKALLGNDQKAAVQFVKDSFVTENLTDAEIYEHVKRLVALRERIKSQIKQNPGQPVYIKVEGKSKGVAVQLPKDATTNLPQELDLDGRLISENTEDFTSLTHPDGQGVQLVVVTAEDSNLTNYIKPGRLVVYREDGTYFRVFNRQFTTAEKDNFIEMLKMLSMLMAKQTVDANSLTVEDRDNLADILTNLNGMVFWSTANNKSESKGKFYIDPAAGTLVRGTQSFVFTPEAIEANKTALTEGLYHQVNNKLLKSNNEYRQVVIKNGKVEKNAYSNYVHYLLGKADMDGAERQLGGAVVYTNTPTYTTDDLNVQLKSVYFTFNDEADPYMPKVMAQQGQAQVPVPAGAPTVLAAPGAIPFTMGPGFGGGTAQQTTQTAAPVVAAPGRIPFTLGPGFGGAATQASVPAGSVAVPNVITSNNSSFTISPGFSLGGTPLQNQAVNNTPSVQPGSGVAAPALMFTPPLPVAENPEDNAALARVLGAQGNIPLDVDFPDPDGSFYRLAQEKTEVKPENFQKLYEWFEKNLPNIPVNKVAHLIDNKAWGAFKRGAVYISENAEEGTGFHEAFEAVWNAYLTFQEQIDLAIAFRSREGSFTNPFTNETKRYAEASMYDVREMLAEEFREDILNQGKQTIKGKIASFFKDLWNFIKSVLGLSKEADDIIQQTFKKINKGKYANARFARDPGMMGTAYSLAIPNTTQEFSVQVTEGMTGIFFQHLFKDQKNIDSLLSKDADTNKLLKELFAKSWQDLLSHLVGDKSVFVNQYVRPYEKQLGRSLTDAEKYNLFSVYKTQDPDAKMIQQVVINPDAVYNNFKLSLRKFGIEFREVIRDEDLRPEDMVTDGLGIRDAIFIDPRRTTAVNFRVLLGTLTEDEYDVAQQNEGNPFGVKAKTNRIGLSKLVDFDKVHSMLINELNSSVSVFRGDTFMAALDVMMEKLDKKYGLPDGKYRKGYEWIHRLKKRLKYTGPGNQYFTQPMKLDDIMLLIGFEKSLMNKQTKPLKTVINQDNLIYDMDPIQENNDKKIRDTWENNVIRTVEPLSSKSPEALLGMDEKGMLVIDRNSYAFKGDPNDRTKPFIGMARPSFNQILQNLAQLGVTFSASQEELKKDSKVIIESYDAIVSKIMDGSIRTMDDLFGNTVVGSRVKNLINVESRITSEDNVLMHMTASGEPQYSITLPSNIAYTINSLNSSETLADFVRSNPQFGWVDNDQIYIHPYQSRSLILKPGGLLFDSTGKKRKDASIIYHLISGMADSEALGKDTADLTYPDRVMQEIHYLLKNIHYTIINSDKSTEFALGLNKPFVTFREAMLQNTERGNEKVMSVYLDQLSDEIDAAIRENELPNNIQYYSKEVKQLGHYREILGEKLVKEFKDKVLTGKLDKNQFINKPEVAAAIQKHISNLVKETIDGLLELDIITAIPTETNGFVYSTKAISEKELAGLSTPFINPSQMSQVELEAVVAYLAINKEIAVTEQHKLIYGHPVMFKDLAKRANGANSTKDAIVDNYEVIQWMDRNMSRLDGKSRSENRIQTFKNISFKDQKVLSSFYKELAEGLYASMKQDMPAAEASKQVGAEFDKNGKFKNFIRIKNSKGQFEFTGQIKAYLELNEADAMAWIMPDMYRDMLFLSAKLTKEQIKQWEYEKAYEIVNRSKKRVSDPAYKEYDQKTIEDAQAVLDQGNPGVIMNVLKPQYFGYANNPSMMQTVFLKHSTQPKFYRQVEGTQYERLYLAAQRKQVDIIGFESGEKVGNMLNDKGEFLPIYNTEGEINVNVTYDKKNRVKDIQLPAGMPVQELYTRYYGIQQEVPSVAKEKVVRGTQVTKLVMSNFTNDEGEFTNDTVKKLVEDYNETLRDLTKAGKAQLLEEFGMVQFEDGTYATSDLNKLVRLLKAELEKRDLPSNLIDGLVVSQDKSTLLYRFDTLANRNKIDNILNNIVDSRVISPKMFGKAAVQVAATGYETLSRNAVYLNDQGTYESVEGKDLTEEQKKTVQQTSSDLKFYRLENGRIQSMEVYLPWFFEGVTPEEMGLKLVNGVYSIPANFDKRLLEAVGFRIPTQGMNSIESIVIKGFLPKEVGDMVVVPSEIVGKAGSDFDIDKLNIYLSNHYVEEVNKNYGSAEFKEFLRAGLLNLTEDGHNVYSKNQVDQIMNFFTEEDLANINRANYTVEGKEAKGGVLALEEFIPDLPTREIAAKVKSVITRYNAAVKGKKVIKYVEQDTNSQASLQNKLKSIMQELIAQPENFRQLVLPNSTATLKSLAEEINGLKNKEDAEKSFLALRKFIPMAEVRERYLTGKRMVGIGALQQTSHTMSQVAGIKLSGKYDAKMLYYLFGSERERDIVIRLKHNKNAKNEFYLYAKKDQDGKWISELISEGISGFVDAAKDPFVFELNLNFGNAGTWFYLQKLGVPVQDIAYLFNQPIIEQYTKEEAKNNSFFKKVNGENLTRFALMMKVMAPYMEKVPSLKGKYDLFQQSLDGIERLENEGEQTGKTYRQINQLMINYRVQIKKIREDVASELVKLRDMSKTYSSEELRNAIKKHHTKGNIITKEDAVMQLGLMADYLEYSQQAGFLTEFIRSIGYDNTRTKTIIENELQMYRWNKMRNAKFIANPDDLLNKTFIGELKKQKDDISNLFQNLFISLSPTKALPAFQPLYEQLNNREIFMTQDDQIELINRYQNFFISYAVQTTPYTKDGIQKTINGQYEQLMKGAQSLAKQLRMLKESTDINIRENPAVKELLPILNSDTTQVDNIRLFKNRMDTYKNDIMIEAIVNLRTYAEASNNAQLRDFVDNLAIVAIMQSGLQDGRMNFTKILPVEVYTKLVNTVVNTFMSNEEPVNGRLIWRQFHQNNVRNSLINPRVKFAKKNKLNNTILLDTTYGDSQFDYVVKTVIQPALAGARNAAARQQLIDQGRGAEVFDTVLYEKVVSSEDLGDSKYAVYKPIGKLGDGFRFTEVYAADMPSAIPQNNNIDPTTGTLVQVPRVNPAPAMLATASVVTYSGSANSLASGPIPFTMGEGFGIPGMTATAAQPQAAVSPALDAKRKQVETIVTAPGYVKESAKKYLSKELFKIRQATQFIGTGGGNDSTTQRMENAYAQVGLANTGNYTSSDLVYVSSNGNRANRYSPFAGIPSGLQGPYQNIDKVIAAGGRIIMDTAQHLANTRSYNIGEVDLAVYLANKGYTREDATGIWSPAAAQSEIPHTNKGWSRKSDNGYEVSTKGDTRFSAFNARIKGLNNRSIEEIYQTEVKGYKTMQEGKGKPALTGISREEQYIQYRQLWEQWARENSGLMQELAQKTQGKVLTDMFANSDINQARALSEILNEYDYMVQANNFSSEVDDVLKKFDQGCKK